MGAALLAVVLGGCAMAPDRAALVSTPIVVRTLETAAPATDGRARFREIFCSTLRRDGVALVDDASCERWLWRLPDERAQSQLRASSPLRPAQLAVFLVTGAFSECVGEEARPFAAGAAQLRTAGALVETIVVSGRSGTEHNAKQIADALGSARIADDQLMILIGYSKGALDVLRFLVDYPDAARRVHAAVSVAGPIFGSAVAAAGASTYSALISKLPNHNCPPGDGNVLRSITPEAAQAWLEASPLPAHVRYYSLAGFTTRERIARALTPSWKFLNRTDPRNDGQVMAAGAVVPASTLLGYVNADHWGLAISMESVHTFIAARRDPAVFPLRQLFLSIVQFVIDEAELTAIPRMDGPNVAPGGSAMQGAGAAARASDESFEIHHPLAAIRD